MKAYVDSSVLLRIVLGEKGRLRQWSKVTAAISSELTRLECLRTLDRARIRLGLTDADVSRLRADTLSRLEAFDIVRLDSNVLERASQPLPTLVGSPDAIHLASALMLRGTVPEMVFATHDADLARAARACGFVVYGV